MPALVVLGIYWGIHDGSAQAEPVRLLHPVRVELLPGQPGRAAWAPRGPRSTWNAATKVAALLGIPAGFTQVVLFPVAWTTQRRLPRPVARRPAREITYLDQWGFTDVGIPPADRGNPLEGLGVCVSIDIHAAVERVWELATDITTPSRHCAEAAGAAWESGIEPGLGAVFKGRNATADTGHPAINEVLIRLVGRLEWETPCTVTAWEPGRRFEYGVGTPGNPSARCGFRLEPLLGGGVRLEHYLRHGPARSGTSLAAAENPDQAAAITSGRFRSGTRT